MGPLGSDIDQVKKQIDQLSRFKSEVDPQMVKVEALNRYEHDFSNKFIMGFSFIIIQNSFFAIGFSFFY